MELRNLKELSEKEINTLAGISLALRGAKYSYAEIEKLLMVRGDTVCRWLKANRVDRAKAMRDKLLSQPNNGTIVQPTVRNNDKSKAMAYLCIGTTGKDPKTVRQEAKDAEERLKGFKVQAVSPMAYLLSKDLDWISRLRECIPLLLMCDTIYIGGDISRSKRARMELKLAQDLGYKVLMYKYSDEKIGEIL